MNRGFLENRKSNKKIKTHGTTLIPVESIQERLYLIRGQKVMLDQDLAELYQVEGRQLKRQVRRNIDRFPTDFMFELSLSEHNSLRCQFGTLKRGEHVKYQPYAFTEQGVAMLSGVLHSKRAVQVNIAIMRAFVQLRRMISLHGGLAKKIADHEKKIIGLTRDVLHIFNLIQPLLDGPIKKLEQIGFKNNNNRSPAFSQKWRGKFRLARKDTPRFRYLANRLVFR